MAVPTLTAATCYKLLKIYPTLTHDHLNVILIGNLVSFIVGAITIKSFVSYLSKFGFKHFGYYRIAVGVVILVLLSLGIELKDI